MYAEAICEMSRLCGENTEIVVFASLGGDTTQFFVSRLTDVRDCSILTAMTFPEEIGKILVGLRFAERNDSIVVLARSRALRFASANFSMRRDMGAHCYKSGSTGSINGLKT